MERPSEKRSSIHTAMGPATEVRATAWIDWHWHGLTSTSSRCSASAMAERIPYCTVFLLSLLVPGTDCQGVNHVLCNAVHTLYLIVMIHACPRCPELCKDWYWDAKNTPPSLRLYPHFAQWEWLSLFLFPSISCTSPQLSKAWMDPGS